MTPPPRMPPRFGGPPPRNGSAASGHFMPPGPRSFSSASGRGPPPQRKPMPPPAPLHLLPTPSMLKEDAFASPVIFAPSSRIPGDGTESPGLRGGLRPYSPSVSPHVPLASAFDELSLLPNPHSLRNSSTFTGLDFAPPRKFKNDDAVSDAGSIRSNNSGVTAQQIQNIRNGAYRVSRIPQDVVPAKEAISSNLKPTWDMPFSTMISKSEGTQATSGNISLISYILFFTISGGSGDIEHKVGPIASINQPITTRIVLSFSFIRLVQLQT
ncbi:uncharacterized protein LAJ45_05188 [Morchella importuna]|uniref:uncharacterized protein n=1 Tax=Morchella importuna TaxID=1174673 RepID=UPI001E8CCB94|nr:uncharacterized protein LAJ45_05188 [Morchella importuna]KAH8150493.1 hypothetical protein LAJ45_05188 [Morchella importuna]